MILTHSPTEAWWARLIATAPGLSFPLAPGRGRRCWHSAGVPPEDTDPADTRSPGNLPITSVRTGVRASRLPAFPLAWRLDVAGTVGAVIGRVTAGACGVRLTLSAYQQ